MTGPNRSGNPWLRAVGTCQLTGKRMFLSRSDAKTVLRVVDRRMHAYRCGDSDHWHIGHMPGQVRRGEISRDQIEMREAS